MSICSDDLMGLAEDLLDSGTEASDRSAVSRSYYALLHEASDRSKAMGLTARTGSGSHANVISGYRTAGGRLSYIGREIQKRKIMRNVADYDIHLLVDGPEARTHVEACKSLIDDLRRITIRAKA